MTASLPPARAPWRLLGMLALTALLARGAAALLIEGPPYLDAAYYELVARRLVGGDGFSVPVLWSFLEVGGRLPPDPHLPVASNGHWMPMTSILSAISMLAFGESHLAAKVPSVVIGAGLVTVTGLIAWNLSKSRQAVAISGILALFAGPMLLLVPLVDSFALFGIAGVAVLYASMRVVNDPGAGAWLILAGSGTAVATLTRVDGMVLALAPITAWLIRRRIGPWRVDHQPISGWWAAGAVLVAAAVMAPWFIRQWLTFGSPLPSAGGHTLWITSYNEQFSVGREIGLGAFLSWGPINILASKLTSFGLLLGRTAVLLGGIFVVSFAFGLISGRTRAPLAPFTVYFAALFLVMGAIFTFHAPQGAYYHSAWAWLPFAIPIAVTSFGALLERLGRLIPLFARPRNVRFLQRASVVGAVILSLAGSAAVAAEWRAGRERVETAAAFLQNVPRADVVMYVDPPTLHLLTGNPVVAPPFDPPAIVGSVAAAYDVRWVVVERLPGAERDPLGLWQGADWLAANPSLATDTVRIYEVQTRAS